MLVGVFAGELLGVALNVDANIGGVGIAMLIFVLVINYLQKRNYLKKPTQEGISFWISMYIPIVVAMAAQQNVVSALKGGPMAILAGVCAVLISFALIPLLSGSRKRRIPQVHTEKENSYVQNR